MKTIIVVGDGMADTPVSELGGKTPLMLAETPAMDRLSSEGLTGLFRTIEPDLPAESAVANLTILGYNPRQTFQGRGVLEAASLGVQLSDSDLAARVNLICIEAGGIRSHSAGHISSEEAHPLIRHLQSRLRHLNVRLVQGLSYRHVLVIPEGDARVKCAAPHDHKGEPFEELLVKPLVPEAQACADLLNQLILESQHLLSRHPINRKRETEGKQPANSLWPWSPGMKPQMITFQERFGISGAVITGVDVIKGLGIYAGFEVIPVEGATGFYDTNYEGKADACLRALEDYDLVYVHVEAPDEAGHEQNIQLKIQCIEDFDRRLLQRILSGLEKLKMDVILAVLPDHPTPIAQGTHTREPVPVAIRFPRKRPDGVNQFDEQSVKAGDLGLLEGSEFIEMLLGGGGLRIREEARQMRAAGG
jgi:2,3-bisphosphoglycerate-independent phosphoglycerate mutase